MADYMAKGVVVILACLTMAAKSVMGESQSTVAPGSEPELVTRTAQCTINKSSTMLYTETYKASYVFRTTTKCGFWSSCTVYRLTYRVQTREATRTVYHTSPVCCKGWVMTTEGVCLQLTTAPPPTDDTTIAPNKTIQTSPIIAPSNIFVASTTRERAPPVEVSETYSSPAPLFSIKPPAASTQKPLMRGIVGALVVLLIIVAVTVLLVSMRRKRKSRKKRGGATPAVSFHLLKTGLNTQTTASGTDAYSEITYCEARVGQLADTLGDNYEPMGATQQPDSSKGYQNVPEVPQRGLCAEDEYVEKSPALDKLNGLGDSDVHASGRLSKTKPSHYANDPSSSAEENCNIYESFDRDVTDKALDVSITDVAVDPDDSAYNVLKINPGIGNNNNDVGDKTTTPIPACATDSLSPLHHETGTIADEGANMYHKLDRGRQQSVVSTNTVTAVTEPNIYDVPSATGNDTTYDSLSRHASNNKKNAGGDLNKDPSGTIDNEYDSITIQKRPPDDIIYENTPTRPESGADDSLNKYHIYDVPPINVDRPSTEEPAATTENDVVYDTPPNRRFKTASAEFNDYIPVYENTPKVLKS